MAGEKEIFKTLMTLEKEKKDKEIVKIIESHRYDNNPAFQYYLAHLYYTGYIYEKDINHCIEYLRLASIQGYASACFMLCTIFERGNGVEQDFKLSNDYLLQAANKNYLPAVNHLGEILVMGREDIAIDEKAAFEKFKYCHEKGYAKASINYGYCLLYGVGTPADPALGVNLLKKYAFEGHMEAQYNLGKAYYDGIGVPRDIVKAVYYFQEATRGGQMFAAKLLGDCYYDGQGVNIDHQLAFKYYKRAADLGNNEAAEIVANSFIYGDGVKASYEEAMNYLVKSARNGNRDAQLMLGDRYYAGNGFRKNLTRAFYWYQESAKLNESRALKKCGDMLLVGEGCKKDIVRAAEYYVKAIDRANYDAAFPLAELYENPTAELKRDYVKAVEYYEIAYINNYDPVGAYRFARLVEDGKSTKVEYTPYEIAKAYIFAAEKGYLPAAKKAGECYLKGNGVKKDYISALRYYLMAAKNGDEEAKDVVEIIRRDASLKQIEQ